MIHNVFITGDCNLDCSFCFAKEIRAKPSQQKAIKERVRTSKADLIRFCGGEPLNDWELLAELIELSPSTATLSINTNGRLLTNEHVDYFNEHNVTVQLSIDGYDRGERPLTALNLTVIKRLKLVAVNQILFFPSDISRIASVLRPTLHEVCFLRGVTYRDEKLINLAQLIPTNVLISGVDGESEPQETTHQDGQHFGSVCCWHSIIKEQIGSDVWQVLRGR